jgi:hypothetical protein
MYAKTSWRPPPSRLFLNLLYSLVSLPLRYLVQALLGLSTAFIGDVYNTQGHRCQATNHSHLPRFTVRPKNAAIKLHDKWGCSVPRPRSRRAVVGLGAVHRAGRGEDQPRGSGADESLEDGQSAAEVGMLVAEWIGP